MHSYRTLALQNTSLLVRHLGSSYVVSEAEDITMKRHVRTLAPVLIVFFAVAGAQALNAQIINAIQAHIDHTFVIGDKSLPPGEYTFRMTTDPGTWLRFYNQERPHQSLGYRTPAELYRG